jgi:hypothetical protein
VKGAQRHALRRQAVDVRRADEGIAGRAKLAEALVVRKYQYDVSLTVA